MTPGTRDPGRSGESGTGEAGTGEAGEDPGAHDAWAREVVALASSPASRRYALELSRRAPASYRERTPPTQAALDADELLALFASGGGGDDDDSNNGDDSNNAGDSNGGGGPPPRAARPATGRRRFAVRSLGKDGFHIRRFADRPVELTALLPMIESFGLVVEESVPYRFELGPGPAVIDDIGVHLERSVASSRRGFDATADGPRLVEALDAVVTGRTRADALNELVPSAGMDWREVLLLRAYTNYWAQCEPSVPPDDVEEALRAFPSAARALVDYFTARFDPSDHEHEAAARAACVAELGQVPVLRRDRALRVVLQLVDATVRTNFFQRTAEGAPKETVTLKLESAAVPQLPSPVPRVETWVHAPRLEGIHLRAGLVARGGIRWSERPDDLRTEVLDLMAAQVKKNAIIVPTGAKGGFVCRMPRPNPLDVQECYASFVSALLDVTDDLEGGKVVTPARVVAHDGPDPYLVVAADKGTAEFSDLANALSAAHGYWLGDAFASGGSHGYNHKAMGITARGAWVAVRHHFHQLGIDVQREPILVAGVGDMSGDVFGNGMLSSSAIRLVAAFDHRHVFLDPDPDPARSFAERARLAGLAHSSWADYSNELLSPGGGVWSRDAKVVPLAPEVRRVLGTARESLSPPELISAILEAPVDLLWFGGVGTFVKAASESDTDVGDRANNEVRVTADRVRARVIGEGGNLGLTQEARIRYSRRGGRINTDFIDNAAGVATSDREVNVKILLALAVEEGRLTADARDEYLQRAQDEVATDVLRQIDHCVAALNRAVPDSAGQLDAYAALIDLLEAGGRFHRSVEALPGADELAVRRGAGAGMIRPELAVLLAYAKSDLGSAIEAASFVADPSLSKAVEAYFPSGMRRDFGDLVGKHRLYDQILATEIAAEIVDQLGIVWSNETAAELGCEIADTAAAYWAAREVVGASALWEELDARWVEIPADADATLHGIVSSAVADLARAYLRRGERPQPRTLIAADLSIADEIAASIAADPRLSAQADDLVAMGVGRTTVERLVTAQARSRVGDIGPVVRATGRAIGEITAAFDLVDAAAGVDRMVRAVRGAATPNRWRSWLARATLDDLADWRRHSVVEILQEGGDPADPVDGWAAQHEVALASARRLLQALDTQGADPTTVVAVALRRLPRPAPADGSPG